ncbi:ABC-2 family transporter protein [Candidatus Woesebacteria bacterium]|nr:ABC-2 family transporter protein [Candidatus Woesebacteria bacterium]
MKRIARIYRQLFKANWSKTLVYRMDFLNSVISGFLWGGFSIITITLLTSNVSQVAGWKSGEIQMLNAAYWVLAGVFHLFFTKNFSAAARMLHYGEIDSLALKPINTLFLLTTSEISYASTIRMSAGIIFLFWLADRQGITLSPDRWALFFLTGIAGIAILYAVHVFLISLLLWRSYLSNLVELGSLYMSTARNPVDLLRYVPTALSPIFFVALITVSIPTQFLLGKGTLLRGVFLIATAGVLLFISTRLWNYSLKKYTGASG